MNLTSELLDDAMIDDICLADNYIFIFIYTDLTISRIIFDFINKNVVKLSHLFDNGDFYSEIIILKAKLFY